MWAGGIRAAPAGRPSSSRKLNVAQALGCNNNNHILFKPYNLKKYTVEPLYSNTLK